MKKEKRDQIIAKVIWNVISVAWTMLCGGAIAVIACMGIHHFMPELTFYNYLIVVGVCMFGLMIAFVALTYKIRVAIYHLLCKIEKVMKK